MSRDLHLVATTPRRPRVNHSYDQGYWALVVAFIMGGMFGVGACACVWPLVAAGVLP